MGRMAASCSPALAHARASCCAASSSLDVSPHTATPRAPSAPSTTKRVPCALASQRRRGQAAVTSQAPARPGPASSAGPGRRAGDRAGQHRAGAAGGSTGNAGPPAPQSAPATSPRAVAPPGPGDTRVRFRLDWRSSVSRPGVRVSRQGVMAGCHGGVSGCHGRYQVVAGREPDT